MGDDHRRYSKKGTGTVPKIKCRNNVVLNRNDGQHQNFLSNDLGSVEFSRNSRRNFVPSNYCTMSSSVSDEQNSYSRLNEMPLSVTPTASGPTPTSRRDSIGNVPKCDNVTKYPNKRQIEDKLNQIREYIRVTSSLMSTIKNGDDQSDTDGLGKTLADLKDSEAKLVAMLEDEVSPNCVEITENDSVSESGYTSNNSQRNDLEQRVESASRELEMLCDQHNTFLGLKQKAENKMRDARHVQEKLMQSQCDQKLQNQLDSLVQDFLFENKNLLENECNSLDQRSTNSENLNSQVNLLQERLNMLHASNDARNELIQALDKRDEQVETFVPENVKSEHQQLQEKLAELQTKKMQVDRLVSQLQNLDEQHVEEDDIASQVRKICTMKDQLSKLRDMYDMVKCTESALDSDCEENARALPLKTENVIQNCVNKKQVNMNSAGEVRAGARPKVSAEAERVRLQAELQAKKRELEEIMCKHKAGTSNLNHDVGGETKSEFGNALFEGVSTSWYPVLPIHHNRPTSSNRYSSDDGLEPEANDYTDLNSASEIDSPRQQQPSRMNAHEEPETRPECTRTSDYERFRLNRLSTMGSPARHVDTTTTTRSSVKRDVPGKTQLAKQLELIRSVCDSLLEQQQQQQQQQNSVRNNLSPSPLYSEVPAMGNLEPNEYVLGEVGGYQSLLATNALQTQAFMLNTLNQCCQMLWLQQRELVALRNSVGLLQERFERPVPYMEGVHPLYPPSNLVHSEMHAANNSNVKTNPVAAACSLPNLNHQQMHHDPHAYQQNNNMRLFPGGLNNLANQPIWNGQALNNQVVPGNRANNYWDNFRSYSRQNLLSTKSNEGPQNTNNASERTYLLPGPKINHPHETVGLPDVRQPRRKPWGLVNSVSAVVGPPPDVLNVNQTQKSNNEASEFINSNEGAGDATFNFQPTLREFGGGSSNQNKNEWHDGEDVPKSKSLDDLHENVYREVASLISANQGRLHFLLHLFRDLRFMSSDPLRCKTLQSIHSLISADFNGENTDLVYFLEMHDEEVVQPHLIDMIVELFVDKSQESAVKDALRSFRGQKVSDVRAQLLETLTGLPRIEENAAENVPVGAESSNPLQNEDLAEADQTHLEVVDMEEEEGAVGGVFNIPNVGQIVICEAELSGLDFTEEGEEFGEQGLDQVPTRLTTGRLSSGATTPSKGGVVERNMS